MRGGFIDRSGAVIWKTIHYVIARHAGRYVGFPNLKVSQAAPKA
jgi:hypothetical protein